MKTSIRTTVIVIAPDKLVVANRTSMKSFLLAQLGLGANVILDLSATATLDSSALGMLISVEKSFRLAGRGFVLCALHEELPALFEVTQVDRRIGIAPDVAHAHRMLAMPPLPDHIPSSASEYLALQR